MTKLLYVTLFLFNFSYSQESKNMNNTLEKNLINIKNQAFCDCYFLATSKESSKYKDGSAYIEIITTKNEYIFQNKQYWKIINEWNKKTYKSYDKNNNLYIMKCLDLYNSNILKKFIDSVKKEELKFTQKSKNKKIY